MSRYSEISIQITSPKKLKVDGPMADALEIFCPFEWSTWESDYCLKGTGRVNIGGGVTDEEQAKELADTAFSCSDVPLHVEVRITDLENQPFDEFHFGANEYEAFKAKKGVKHENAGDSSVHKCVRSRASGNRKCKGCSRGRKDNDGKPSRVPSRRRFNGS